MAALLALTLTLSLAAPALAADADAMVRGKMVDFLYEKYGEDVWYNGDMVQYPEIRAKIHEKLADYGFILRYPEGREHITGYGYEPWHIRCIDDQEIAREIMDGGWEIVSWGY